MRFPPVMCIVGVDDHTVLHADQGPACCWVYLDEAVHTAGDEHLAVRREAGALRVGLGAELDGAVQEGGEALHLILLPLSCAPEQVKGSARRQETLRLLPAPTINPSVNMML